MVKAELWSSIHELKASQRGGTIAVILGMLPETHCPDPESLLQFLGDDLQDHEHQALQLHMDSCGECLQVFAALASQHFTSRENEGTNRAQNDILAAGEAVGRFIVLHQVGRGGMGDVYAAYDPELDRKVALKLMQQAGENANASLLHEARLIAKLNHANIVSVYDVGKHNGAVYLAMEFVDGPATIEYFRGKSLNEIISYFEQVANGLIAAHDQGIVHRDIKPANLLMRSDLRACIADFGLAKTRASAERVGTPAYMAPEQSHGRATPLSDQYSFCVSLLQVVTGILHTPAAALPKETPEPLRALLRRGLQESPRDRFEDMQAVRQALSPQVPRRWWLGLPLLVALASSTVLFLWPSKVVIPPCSDSARHLESIWNEESKADLSKRFSKLPGYGIDLWNKTLPRLDAYREAWVAHHRKACEATQVHKDQSSEAMDLSMQCLANRRAEFFGIISALRSVPLESVGKSSDALALLAEPSVCVSPTATQPLPADEQTRERIVELQPQVSEWIARAAMGELDSAAEALRSIRSEAEKVGYLPLQAEVHAALATILSKLGQFEESEDEFQKAIALGTQSRHDLLVAKSWLELSWLHGHHQERYKDAHRDLQNGLAFSKRLGTPGDLPMVYARNSGWLALHEGNLDQALDFYKEAMRLARANDGQERDVAMLHSDLGSAYLTAGNVVKAAEHYGLALHSLSSLLGKHHPDTLSVHNNYAVLLREQGKLDEAITEFAKARLGFQTSMKSSEVYEAQILNNLAVIYADQEKWEVAEQTYREALVFMERAYLGKEHAGIARALHGLATVVQLDPTREIEAEQLHKKSLDMKERLLGKDHPSVAISLSGLADFYVATKRKAEAIAAVKRGLKILIDKYGEEHPQTIYLRDQLVEIEAK